MLRFSALTLRLTIDSITGIPHVAAAAPTSSPELINIVKGVFDWDMNIIPSA